MTRDSPPRQTSLIMSMVEIAEVAGKRRDDVLTYARKMLADLKKDALSFQAVYLGANGEPRRVLNLPRSSNA